MSSFFRAYVLRDKIQLRLKFIGKCFIKNIYLVPFEGTIAVEAV